MCPARTAFLVLKAKSLPVPCPRRLEGGCLQLGFPAIECRPLTNPPVGRRSRTAMPSPMTIVSYRLHLAIPCATYIGRVECNTCACKTELVQRKHHRGGFAGIRAGKMHGLHMLSVVFQPLLPFRRLISCQALRRGASANSAPYPAAPLRTGVIAALLRLRRTFLAIAANRLCAIAARLARTATNNEQ